MGNGNALAEKGRALGFTGLQATEITFGNQAIISVFALSVLIVYLVLAAQYESWILPFIILLGSLYTVTGGIRLTGALPAPTPSPVPPPSPPRPARSGESAGIFPPCCGDCAALRKIHCRSAHKYLTNVSSACHPQAPGLRCSP